jgi:Cu/Ag efflux protein CusF
MKNFENKQTSITIGIAGTQDTKEMTYADLAKVTLDIPPADGWSKNEMKIRIKTEAKLENLAAGDEIELEDTEMEKILELSNQPWQLVQAQRYSCLYGRFRNLE